MKVFISSAIQGLEEHRDAAAQAVRSLGHEVGRSEDFPALAETPQGACLEGVREADVVLLLLGFRYGHRLDSGLSATHEEYREARDRRPVLAFIQRGVEVEDDQMSFINEVRKWEGGTTTADFSTPDDLMEAAIRALHEFEMSRQAGQTDPDEMQGRAQELLPDSRGVGGAALGVVVVGGPRQTVLRPAELDDPELERDLLQAALLGDDAVLSTSKGTSTEREDRSLLLEHPDGSVLVNDLGSIRILQPARSDDETGYSLPALIEEDIAERLGRAIRLAGWIVDRVDSVRRLREVLPIVCLSGASYMGLRTRAEHAQSPNSISIPSNVSDPLVISLAPVYPRGALLHDTDRLVADFVSVLRRSFRP